MHITLRADFHRVKGSPPVATAYLQTDHLHLLLLPTDYALARFKSRPATSPAPSVTR
jgi:hypothetical protein